MFVLKVDVSTLFYYINVGLIRVRMSIREVRRMRYAYSFEYFKISIFNQVSTWYRNSHKVILFMFNKRVLIL